MTAATIEQRVTRVIAEYTAVDLAAITQAATIDDLGLDSLDEVEILMELEDEFSIAIPDDVKPRTVAELVKAVTDQLGEVA